MAATDEDSRPDARGASPVEGFAPIPRWSREPPGSEAYEFAVEGELGDGIRRLAATLGVGEHAVVLAAHAKVVGALSGEDRVALGLSDGDAPLPCVVDLVHRTWRELILHAGEQAEASATSGAPFETVLVRGGACAGTEGERAAGEITADGVLLRIELRHVREGAVLALRCRREAVDAAYAERIAGYHLTALRLAVAAPDAQHGLQTLLGEAELRYQVEELSGPPRELPDRRVHEIFAETARRRPDAVAAVCGDEELTYAELDRRANRLAHALLEHGLEAEDTVAVVTDRTLDWMAAVLGVFKAGGCYLPVEPHFPAERVTTMLRKADCRIALVDKAGHRVTDQAASALTGLNALPLGGLLDSPYPDSEPAVPVTAGRLAYIYFTSGSTGQPKGVMCEHAGMLNHMLAKIDDMEIEAGTVVAQTAPQCFDISLWQLVAPLLVGGTTLIVPQPVLLEVGRFVAELERGEVEVVQLVPSYLDVLLAELNRHPVELPALRRVSATGEALKPALVRRWFETFPGVPLVNAYGLTETCDDTNHEVLTAPPDGPGVPLGRPVPGAEVYVVDRNLLPVPLGAPGEIVFSGVCVARGYVNDPVRTSTSYSAAPLHPGGRLYRSGDFGRWSPDGRLEFSGRKDTQVKVRGFRIEIQEIEDRLLRVAGVREAAVLVTGAQESDRRLVACYAAPPSLPVGSPPAELARDLPEYMLPSDWYWLDALPLTGNGKVDRRELERITTGLHRGVAAQDGPRTAAERTLAAVWAEVLGVPPEQVGRSDDFFGSGGSSLSAVRLVIALDREISLGDVTRHPVLRDLARVLDGRKPGGAHGCLHRLTPGVDSARGTLVCFPYAGGDAVNYLPLARELSSSGWEVLGVEPPGRDAAGPGGFVEVPDLARLVAAELAGSAAGPLLLMGHSVGTAAALETARLLRRQGRDVVRVFLGAQLPGTAQERQAQIDEVAAAEDAEIAAELAADSGLPELADAGGAHTARLAAAYRHDVAAACRALIEAGTDGRPRLDVPVTVVLADNDPGTQGDPADWTRFAEDVEVRTLDGGGHFFLTGRAAELAEIIGSATAPA